MIRHLRGEIEVAPEDALGRTRRCAVRASVPPLVTGDRVRLERQRHPADGDEAGADADADVIVERLPRTRVLARHTARGVRAVCANLDLLLITVAPEPRPHADLLDRYLLAAALDELDAVIVVSKGDLLAADATARAELEALLAPRRALGVGTVITSVRGEPGVDALSAHLAQRRAALVGQSGVGKSSLVNALVPGADAATGEVSRKRNRGRGRGRHTTSTTRLYACAGGILVDSPGIREFSPDVPDRATLQRGFPEIDAAAAQCRFRDCRHDGEPDCGVAAAAEAGRIDPSRLASFHGLAAALLAPA